MYWYGSFYFIGNCPLCGGHQQEFSQKILARAQAKSVPLFIGVVPVYCPDKAKLLGQSLSMQGLKYAQGQTEEWK